MIDPKPTPRIRDPYLMRVLHANPHKACEVTGKTDRVEAHHCLPRSQRGDDTRANIVMLDADLHLLVTANRPEALQALGAYIQAERPDTIAYLKRKLGDRADDWMRRRLHIEP